MVANWIPETVAADSLVMLAVGITVLAALGYLIAARLRPLAWQRAVWQVVRLAIASLPAAEVAGVSSCLAHLSHLVAAHRRDRDSENRLSIVPPTEENRTVSSSRVIAQAPANVAIVSAEPVPAESHPPLEAPSPGDSAD